MIIDEEPSNISDSHVDAPYCLSVNDICSIEDKCVNNSYITYLNNTDGECNKSSMTSISNAPSDSCDHVMITSHNQMENSNSSSGSKDDTVEGDNRVKENLNNQSQDKNSENTVSKTSLANPSTRMIKCNALCCKMSVFFVMFCIIAICLIPIILYYVGQTSNNEDFKHLTGNNASSEKVSC